MYILSHKAYTFVYAGLAQLAARQSHNLKVVSSSLTFRIIFIGLQILTINSKFTSKKLNKSRIMSDSGCFERPGKKLNKKKKEKMEKEKMEKRVYMMQVILTREQFA